MGVHTWFYKKVERTLEEAKKLALEKKAYWDPKVKAMLEHEATLGLHNERSLAYHLAAREHEVQRVMDGDTVLIYEHQPEEVSFYDYSTGNFYASIKPEDMPIDRYPFRVHGLGVHVDRDTKKLVESKEGEGGSSHPPEVILTSYDETVKWVEEFGMKMGFTGEADWKELTKKFWDAHPDGVITFG